MLSIGGENGQLSCKKALIYHWRCSAEFQISARLWLMLLTPAASGTTTASLHPAAARALVVRLLSSLRETIHDSYVQRWEGWRR